MRIIVSILLCSFLLSSCISFAPVSSTHTGATSGDGNLSTEFGLLGGAGPVLYARGAYGLTDSWDVGALLEQGLGRQIGLWSKYSFLDKDNPNKLAIDGGFGHTAFTGSGTYFYISPIYSYKFRVWEPFVNLRWNLVYINSEHTIKMFSEEHTIHANGAFNYPQGGLGFNIWATDNVGFSFEFGATQFFPYFGVGMLLKG